MGHFSYISLQNHQGFILIMSIGITFCTLTENQRQWSFNARPNQLEWAGTACGFCLLFIKLHSYFAIKYILLHSRIWKRIGNLKFFFISICAEIFKKLLVHKLSVTLGYLVASFCRTKNTRNPCLFCKIQCNA